MCEMWDNFKQVNIHVMGAIRETEKGKRIEKYNFLKKLWLKSSKLMKTIKPRFQEPQRYQPQET